MTHKVCSTGAPGRVSGSGQTKKPSISARILVIIGTMADHGSLRHEESSITIPMAGRTSCPPHPKHLGAHDMDERLKDELGGWQLWARTADKSFEGWQSAYPGWNKLRDAAATAMERYMGGSDDLPLIETCWSISEETEDLADYARAHIGTCLQCVRDLAASPDPSVRWQAYSALEAAGTAGEDLLRRGLGDTNDYCRRRSILGLAKLRPADARTIAEKYVGDPDPYIRRCMVEFADRAHDNALSSWVRDVLSRDTVAEVREAAGNSRSLP
jgi:hypothetical protein